MSEALKRALEIALAQPEPSAELVALLAGLQDQIDALDARVTALEP